MKAEEKITEELDYAILNYSLDVNVWKVKVNEEKNNEAKASMQAKLDEIEFALSMLKSKKGFLDEIRGSKKS